MEIEKGKRYHIRLRPRYICIDMPKLIEDNYCITQIKQSIHYPIFQVEGQDIWFFEPGFDITPIEDLSKLNFKEVIRGALCD